MIGIYTPKLNRFTINNSVMMVYKFAVECEVRVA